jgi:hypothetical protein
MVINKTSAEDIKTHAVSPEFIFFTSLEKFYYTYFKGKESAKIKLIVLIDEITD